MGETIKFYFKRRTSLSLFVGLLTSIVSLGQETFEYSTGFVNHDLATGFRFIDSNVVGVGFFTSLGNNAAGESLTIVFDKTSMNPIDTIITIPLAPSKMAQGYIKFFEAENERYAFEFGYTINAANGIMSLYRLDENYEKDSLVFTRTFSSNFISQNLGWVNGELVVIYLNYDYDTVLEFYDLKGELLRSRTYKSVTGEITIESTVNNFLEPISHPLISKAFILSSFLSPKVYIVDQITLDTLVTYDARIGQPPFYNTALLNNYGILDFRYDKVFTTGDGIVIAGTAFTRPYFISNNDFTISDDQCHDIKYKWDGSHEVRLFGPIDTNNVTRAFGMNEVTKTRVIASIIPKNTLGFVAAEKRKIRVYIYNDWGKLDSIDLFGEMNHSAFDALVDDNGDLFLCGTYSNAWSDDSVFVWVTKLSDVALEILEMKENSKSLQIYPNPTTDYLRINNSQDLGNGTYEIYDQQGKMVIQDRYVNEQINVSQLSAGTYIFVGHSSDGNQYNSLFIKQ